MYAYDLYICALKVVCLLLSLEEEVCYCLQGYQTVSQDSASAIVDHWVSHGMFFIKWTSSVYQLYSSEEGNSKQL